MCNEPGSLEDTAGLPSPNKNKLRALMWLQTISVNFPEVKRTYSIMEMLENSMRLDIFGIEWQRTSFHQPMGRSHLHLSALACFLCSQGDRLRGDSIPKLTCHRTEETIEVSCRDQRLAKYIRPYTAPRAIRGAFGNISEALLPEPFVQDVPATPSPQLRRGHAAPPTPSSRVTRLLARAAAAAQTGATAAIPPSRGDTTPEPVSAPMATEAVTQTSPTSTPPPSPSPSPSHSPSPPSPSLSPAPSPSPSCSPSPPTCTPIAPVPAQEATPTGPSTVPPSQDIQALITVASGSIDIFEIHNHLSFDVPYAEFTLAYDIDPYDAIEGSHFLPVIDRPPPVMEESFGMEVDIRSPAADAEMLLNPQEEQEEDASNAMEL
ncbi:hypothetical protein OE88DRAFT_1644582 [Heliocybe sulcata]|uniref:Uncharacterized protein n=1 Tax=Heliocybe sulcata TaxID=5364 RepID=A0A5C3N4E8_9AGAM|nr:hypothetical protein OE88DRAFT_1644582 [Heliocybe sulcata]